MTTPLHPATRVCKPVLPVAPAVFAGYRALHTQEAKYTEKALREVPAEVAVWYRYLSLFDRTLRREHESPFDLDSDAHVAFWMRLSFMSAAAGTAKLALDAALAGYYSQAFALIRHLLETWLQMVYVRLNNRAAPRWFSSDGIKEPQQPNPNTVINGIKRLGKKEKGLLHNVEEVERLLQRLNKGAHPSALAVTQTETDNPEFRQLAANYDYELFRETWSTGTVAIAMLLHEIASTVTADEVWWDEFASIRDDRIRCFGTEWADT
jgi:hypothetical protein